MARWPLRSGLSTEMVPRYGITRGIDTPVTHRYQSIPELTKNAPARNFRTSRYLIAAKRVAKAYTTMKTIIQIGNVRSQAGNMLITLPQNSLA